jgi:hypothetical protein
MSRADPISRPLIPQVSSSVSDASPPVLVDYATMPPFVNFDFLIDDDVNFGAPIAIAVSADGSQALARTLAGVYWCAASYTCPL